MLPGDFIVNGSSYLPGDTVTLTANPRNPGDLGITNVVVNFYDGDPASGGILISNVMVPGWLVGGATNGLAVASWVVPFPATNHVLYAVATPTNAVDEFNSTNNVQSVSIGGTDLAVSLVSYTVQTNRSARVIAQVQNLGAPAATNSILAIRLNGQAGTPLATASVPALDPGQLAQVALDLPAGTQPAGEAAYQLFADDTHVVPDVNTNNNVVAFSIVVLSNASMPPPALPTNTFNFQPSLFGPPQSLTLNVVSLNPASGLVNINGGDTRQPGTPFSWRWGDGSTTDGFFPQSHTYASMASNYVVTVTAFYSGGSTGTAQTIVWFKPPSLQPVLLPPDTAVTIPTSPETLVSRNGYTFRASLTNFTAASFGIVPQATIEYVLTAAAAMERDFVNGDYTPVNGQFQQVVLCDPSVAGYYPSGTRRRSLSRAGTPTPLRAASLGRPISTKWGRTSP